MAKIWVKKASSFSEAQEQDLDYYLKMRPQERGQTAQFLREQYFKFRGAGAGEEQDFGFGSLDLPRIMNWRYSFHQSGRGIIAGSE